MLTKSDVQIIREVVKEETRATVQEEIAPIKNDIKVMQKDIVQIRKDMKTIIKFFDMEFLSFVSVLSGLKKFSIYLL